MSQRIRLFLLGCLIYTGVSIELSAQDGEVRGYNSDWWQYQQEYIKFSTSETGIYKISVADLMSSGFPLGEVRGDQIQLFSMGVEQRLYVANPDILTEEDDILFYGTNNDGSLDAQLYTDPDEDQLNPLYSLYTDSRPYFLTWSDEGVSPLRYQLIDNGLSSGGVSPKEDYYIHHEEVVYHDFHHKPTHNGRDFIRYSSMDAGEGFGAKLVNTSELKIPIDHLSQFGVDPVLRLRFGTNVLSRTWQVLVNDRVIKSIVQTGYGTVDINERLSRSLLSNSDTLRVTIKSLGSTDEKHTLAYYNLSYPRIYDFEEKSDVTFSQQASIISRSVEIANSSINDPILFNIDKGYIMFPEENSGVINFVSPASFSEDRILIRDQSSGISTIQKLEKYEFSALPDSVEYLFITQSDLIGSALEDYEAYRSSEEGGAYVTGRVNVEHLFNHFAFGVEGHPIALRNYMNFLNDDSKAPQFVLLLGKSIEYSELRSMSDATSYVPTFGSPGSDNLLLSLEGSDVPSAYIGRVAVQSNQDIEEYLRKIKTNENRPELPQTIEKQKWKKSIVHLSGGSSDIQTLLFNYLNNMGEVISQNTFAADITTFRKTTADPIETVKSTEIIETINQGATVLSFFGHSAVGTFDFSLEDPSKYDNQGRNPIILSLGCFSGNIHTSKRGISEDFVLEVDRGATHFIASAGTAYINPQYNIGLDVYSLLGEDMYGDPIGKIMHAVLEKRAESDDIAIKSLVQQMTLHGDPAYRIGTFEGPDLTIDYESVKVSPTIINSTTPTINVEFDVVNLGKRTSELLDIMIIHEYADGSLEDTVLMTVPTPLYSSRFTVDLDNPGFDAIGSNRVRIILDVNNIIDEVPNDLAEENNILVSGQGEEGYQFFVLENTANPVYPKDFGIITHQDDFVLKASLNNAFDFNGEFVVQIDTTEDFNSPLFVEDVLLPESSYINWVPAIELIDQTVYYWRVAPANTNLTKEQNAWKSRSFVYLEGGQKGWNQSHYYQWTKDELYKMAIDSVDRNFTFSERTWDIRIKNKLRDLNDFWVYVNNTPWRSLNPLELAPGISVFAWHPEQVIVSNESGQDFGSLPFSPDGFVFKTDTPEDRQNIKALLESLPSGSRVFLHTLIEDDQTTLNIEEWENDREIYGTTLFDVLESYGSQRVRELKDKGAVPFTMIFDIGGGLVIEDIANTAEETISLSSIGRSYWNEGTVTSTIVGPSRQWSKLEWSEDKSDQDLTGINIYGVSETGSVELLRQIDNNYSISLDDINAELFPYLYLEYVSKDPDRTSAHLEYWRVQHEELSDAILYSSMEEPFMVADTLYAGEELELNFEILNDGVHDFDPILIKYRLIDQNNKQMTLLKRAEAIPAQESVKISETISTNGLGGLYQVSIELNPGEEQPERTKINNFGIAQVYIQPDDRNPFLDVTFDGEHIRDGYITEGKPQIVVSLFDPESRVLLDNPDDIKVTLYYPELLVRDITESDPDVVFEPALFIEDNTARMIINPNLTVKGEYILEVQASDPSGNLAGEYAYRVKFIVDDVVEESKITISPNPFYESTLIDFFLGGRIIPDVFYVRLFSADGLLVRRIEKEDFGGLFYGSNLYRWDGTNEAGITMPSGVYYYEVINSADNSSDKKRGSIIKMR